MVARNAARIVAGLVALHGSLSVALLSPRAARADPGAHVDVRPATPSASGGGFDPSSLSIATQLGLLQPLALGGGNVEVDVRWRWLVVSYSHGWSLDLEGDLVTGDMRDQGAALHIPFSTGFGVGPSLWVDPIRSFVDLRLEGKVHRFEASYDSTDGRTRTEIADYTTFTVGGGAYATVMPFVHEPGPLRGLDASLSFRVWPNVGTTLPGDAVRYESRRTGRTETHEAANIGIANTPMIVNVSLGYVFQ